MLLHLDFLWYLLSTLSPPGEWWWHDHYLITDEMVILVIHVFSFSVGLVSILPGLWTTIYYEHPTQPGVCVMRIWKKYRFHVLLPTFLTHDPHDITIWSFLIPQSSTYVNVNIDMTTRVCWEWRTCYQFCVSVFLSYYMTTYLTCMYRSGFISVYDMFYKHIDLTYTWSI